MIQTAHVQPMLSRNKMTKFIMGAVPQSAMNQYISQQKWQQQDLELQRLIIIIMLVTSLWMEEGPSPALMPILSGSCMPQQPLNEVFQMKRPGEPSMPSRNGFLSIETEVSSPLDSTKE